MSEPERPELRGGVACLMALLTLIAVCQRAAAQDSQAPPAAAADGSLEARLQAAQALLDHSDAVAAEAAFAAANTAEGGKCGRCLLGLARALERQNKLEPALTATRSALALLAGDPQLGRAYCQLGDELLRLKGSPASHGAADAAAAEEAFGKAMAANATLKAEALAGVAEARLQLDRYPQSIDAAEESLQAAGEGEPTGRARSVICRAKLGDNLPSKAFLLPTTSEARRPDNPGTVAGGLISDEILKVGGAVTKPAKIYGPAPQYTEEARKLRVQGVVILEAVIGADGCVVNDVLLKGMPLGLDRAAMEAIEGWVFAPATLAGNPVKVYYTLTINFQVQ